MTTATRYLVHECPECDRPLRGGTKCAGCGWINEAARAAAAEARDRHRCAFVEDGLRCERPGTIARGRGPGVAFVCALHRARIEREPTPNAPLVDGARHLCAYVAGGIRCRNVGTVSRAVGAGVAFLCPAHHRCRKETDAAAIVARSIAAQ